MTRTIYYAAMALLACDALAAEAEVHRLSGDEVAVYNLAGKAEIVPGSGSDVVLRMTRGGDEADALRVETGEVHGRDALRIIYPGDEIAYPELGRGSTRVRVQDDGTFWEDSGGERVRIRGSGSGLEAWADLVVEVPAGKDVVVRVGVGDVSTRNVEADVQARSGRGTAAASNVTGALRLTTGSGRIEVDRVRGDVALRTGSGSIDVRDVEGDVDVDTGSGRVRGRDIKATSFRAETGSGSVSLENLSATDVRVQTGSGDVELDLLVDVDDLDVRTGSGSVTVIAPANLGAEVDLATGSGGIETDFPVTIERMRRNKVVGTLGDGEGSIEIDTGSGGIRLQER